HAAAAAAPTAAELKQSATGAGGPAAVTSGSTALSANTESTVPILGLTAGTAYVLCAVAEDGARNLQATVWSHAFATSSGGPDTTPPVWSASYPATTNATASGFTLLLKASEAGAAYYVVVAAGSAAPTAAQVKARTNYGAVTVIKSDTRALAASTEAQLAVTGLNQLTAYEVYAVAEDGVPNLQAQPAKLSLTTLDGTPPSWTAIYPSAGTITGTSVELRVSLNETGTVFYAVLASGAPAPGASQVKQTAIGGAGGVSHVTAGQKSVTANVADAAMASGLAASTDYDVYLAAEDAAHNLQASAQKLQVTTAFVDTTPPNWLGGYPLQGNLGPTSVDLRVKLNESGTAYYAVLAANAAAPTAAQVKQAGSGGGGLATVAHGSAAVTANSERAIAITGLSAATSYKLYAVAEDATPNLQTTAASLSFTTTGSDTTPPAWETDFPAVVTATTTLTVTFAAQLNESSTVYYVVVAGGAPPPSSDQVKAGTAGVPVLASGSSAVVAGVTVSLVVPGAGLAEGTVYTLYAVAQDHVPNLQASPQKVDFTTVSRWVGIQVDGIKEANWGHVGTLSDGTSLGYFQPLIPPGQDFIGMIHVANDDANLYVGVEKFADHWVDFPGNPPPNGNPYPAHLHIYVTLDPNRTGTVAADNWVGSITFAPGSKRPDYIGHFWTKKPITDQYYLDDPMQSVVNLGDNRGSGATAFTEVRIPLSRIGSPARGATIGILVGARGDMQKPGFLDVAPWKASAVNDWGNSPSAVDPAATDYLLYEIK
ncbi:hypothetical protein ACFL59_15075, partial [Planctomycetota bacterium]